ncbi:hypothetical protein [Yinghuangia seranimata]|uniref:hypothetical protein n=1 Tax=Yinghuangia seranimata TaxID=408067 RepID=UPI00248BF67C|nr:hypothetical protein [Yinghuangia seranimata]MDI2128118.1 hypothetical protein [Yinghuangia seranimata]
MDVTAYVALLDNLDSPDGAVFARLEAELPDHVRRERALPARLERARAVVYHFAGDEPTIRTWRLTGATVAALVEGSAPAAPTLRLLRSLAPKHGWAYLDGVRGLSALVERCLGADPAAWAYVQKRLAAYPGTLPGLVESASWGADEPGAAQRPVVRLPATPRAVTAEFRQLLLMLSADTLAALVPHLHRSTVFDLARFGAPLSPATLAWLVATETPKRRTVLAKARWSRPGLAAALVDLGDTEVNAALYLNAHTSVAVRARIMAAAAEVPLHPSVVARVCGSPERGMRLPALWSGDPLLVRAALLRNTHTTSSVQARMRAWQQGGVEALTQHYALPEPTEDHRPSVFKPPRYRSLLLTAVARLWARHGRDEARRLVDELPLWPGNARYFADLFAADDGLTRLTADVAARTGTKALVKRLRRSSSARLWPLLETPYADWAVIGRAERARPLSSAAWTLLSGMPGCPRREVSEGLHDNGAAQVDAGRWPATREVAAPREWVAGSYLVAEPARRGEPLPAEHLFEAMTPASRALNTFGCLTELIGPPAHRASGAGDEGEPGVPAPGVLMLRYRAHLQSLVERNLGASTDARVVAMRLLPDFPGTTEELLATAGTIARTDVELPAAAGA